MLKKYTLEFKGTVYSFYGESFEDAVYDKDENGEIIKESGNKLFIDNKDKVVETEAEPEYIENIERSKKKSVEVEKLFANLENYLKALDKLLIEDDPEEDDSKDNKPEATEDTGGDPKKSSSVNKKTKTRKKKKE